MYILQTIFDIIIVSALCIGMLNDKKIAEWEQQKLKKIKTKFGRLSK